MSTTPGKHAQPETAKLLCPRCDGQVAKVGVIRNGDGDVVALQDLEAPIASVTTQDGEVLMIRAKDPEHRAPAQPGPTLGGFHQRQTFDPVFESGTWHWHHDACGADLTFSKRRLIQLVAKTLAVGRRRVRLGG